MDFDSVIDRHHSDSLKHDGSHGYFGADDVIPMWVADMDFAAPQAVTDALVQRAKHPIYGYTLYPESMYQAMQGWFASRHQWQIQRNSMMMTPGVVPSIHAAIMALTDVGDQVVVQPPVYFPFFSAVTATQRTLVLNPLINDNGHYRMDFQHLEHCAREGAKALILCSPHNPVGRVWKQDELMQLLAIAQRYNLLIISDEIHADLVFPDERHIPTATLAEEMAIITTISPSKTFNIPGLGLSTIVADDIEHRKRIEKVFNSWHVSNSNPFSICAFEAAYRHGETWLDDCCQYLAENKRLITEFCQHHLPTIKVIESQGTYLLWLDCRGLGLADDYALWRFFIEYAKVGLSPGNLFGDVGSGFMRMNIASSRTVIQTALENIKRAINTLH